MIAYDKCNSNSSKFIGNRTYIYLLNFDKEIDDLEKYFVAEFKTETYDLNACVLNMVVFNDSLLALLNLKYSETNQIIQISLPEKDKPIELREINSFLFPDLIDIIVEKDSLNTIYVVYSSCQIIKLEDYYSVDSYCNQKAFNYTNYHIINSFKTINFNIIHLRAINNKSNNLIYAVSMDKQYSILKEINDAILIESYKYDHNFVFVSTKDYYKIYEFQFPELVININDNETEIVTYPLQFNVSENNSLVQANVNVNTTVYNQNYFNVSKPPINSFLYNYKGETRELDISRAYYGLFNSINVSFNNSIFKDHNIFKTFDKIYRISNPVNYTEKILRSVNESASQKLLKVISTENLIYLLPFLKNKDEMEIVCLELEKTINNTNLTRCSPPYLHKESLNENITNTLVTFIDNNYYIKLIKTDNKHHYFIMEQQNFKENTISIIRKNVTSFFENFTKINGVFYEYCPSIKFLFAYGVGKEKGKSLIKTFPITFTKGKFGIMDNLYHELDCNILKVEFIRERSLFLILCEYKNKTRKIEVRALYGFNSTSTVNRLSDKISDFLIDRNYLTVISNSKYISRWVFSYKNTTHDRDIFLPNDYTTLAKDSSGKDLIGIFDEIIRKRKFMYMIINNDKGDKALYIYDTLEISRMSSYALLSLKGFINSSDKIYGLYPIRIEEDLIIFIPTDKELISVFISSMMKLIINSKNKMNIVNELISINIDKQYNEYINFSDIRSAIIPKNRTNSDKLILVSDELTLNVDTYVKGYGLKFELPSNSKNNEPNNCQVNISTQFSHLWTTDMFNEKYHLLLVDSDLILYKKNNEIHICGLNRSSKIDMIASEHCNRTYLQNDFDDSNIINALLALKRNGTIYFFIKAEYFTIIDSYSLDKPHYLNYDKTKNYILSISQNQTFFAYFELYRNSFKLFIYILAQ